MNLLEEYKNQNTWREWERYLTKLPINQNQIVYDLGCSIGFVSKIFSTKVKKVIGFDNDEYLLEEANKEKQDNCHFILEDISNSNPVNLEKCDGIWLSFALAYIENPSLFISRWTRCLNPGGWFAIVDIDGLFSKHLPTDYKYFNEIQEFENQSYQGGNYDFRIGSKIKSFMEENGLQVVVEEDDWYDKELNFRGKASEEIIKNWEARLNRMIKLKSCLGEKYPEFCRDFLNTISKENHISNRCVQFYVGIKS